MSGTTITFWASPEIFETTVYDFETIRARFQQMAFLNKGLTISLTDERPDAVDEGAAEEAAADAAAEGADAAQADEAAAQAKKGKSVTYCYADGLLDYVKHLNSSKRNEPVHDEIIAFETEDTERMLESGRGRSGDGMQDNGPGGRGG